MYLDDSITSSRFFAGPVFWFGPFAVGRPESKLPPGPCNRLMRRRQYAAPSRFRGWRSAGQECKLGTLPTILRSGPYRFFFYSADRDEPPHAHVERDDAQAKFWLDPVRLERNQGFGRTELRRVESLVEENAALLLEGWRGYFGN